MAPAHIAHSKIIGKLGEGGIEAVYRATDAALNRDIERMTILSVFDADHLVRISREAQLLAALIHATVRRD